MRPVAEIPVPQAAAPAIQRRVHAGADSGALGFGQRGAAGLRVEGEAEQAEHAGGGEQQQRGAPGARAPVGERLFERLHHGDLAERSFQVADAGQHIPVRPGDAHGACLLAQNRERRAAEPGGERGRRGRPPGQGGDGQGGDHLAFAIRQHDGSAACDNVAAGGIEHDRGRSAGRSAAQRRMDVVGGELADGFEFGERVGLDLIIGLHRGVDCQSEQQQQEQDSRDGNRASQRGLHARGFERRGAAPRRRLRTGRRCVNDRRGRGGSLALRAARGGEQRSGCLRVQAKGRSCRVRTRHKGLPSRGMSGDFRDETKRRTLLSNHPYLNPAARFCPE